MKHITKTQYLEYLSCGKNAWLKLYKPELKEVFALSEFEQSLLAKGNLVEEWARKLFPNGVLIESTGEDAASLTKELISKKAPVIFQSTFIHEGFMARNDVLEYDSINDCWNLYEIKGTNSINERSEKAEGRDHIEDAAFQAAILRSVGVNIGSIFIIHLNKAYVRDGDVIVKDLFSMDNVTENVHHRLAETASMMQKARVELTQLDEGVLSCGCLYRGRSAQCTTFRYSYSHVPEYSIHDLSRIGTGKKKLESLVDSGIFDLNDIPDEFELTDIQKNQVSVYKTKKPIIDPLAIKAELSSIVFPLYFLDYESYSPAIPLFNGFKPYQQIPFQFSLDKVSNSSGNVEHFEYLHTEASDPSLTIIRGLRDVIGPEGTIIVWNKTFERMINTQLAQRNPQYEEYLEDINERIYDLKDIFQKQMYVHHGFKGKTSIKNVLPTLIPTLTYKELEIQDGGTATEAWYQMVYGLTTAFEKTEISENLKRYCGRDTHAMVAIWQEVQKLI